MRFSRSAARAALVSAIVACGVSGPIPASDESQSSGPSDQPTAFDSDDGDARDDASTDKDKTEREASPAGEDHRRNEAKNPVILNLPGHGQIVVDVSDPEAAERLIQSLQQMHVEPLPDLPASKFCIGIMVQNLAPETRSVLPLEEAGGVLVQKTFPGGPAAKAGLEPYDVITHLGEKAVADAAALVAAIEETGEKPIELRFLRKGEQKSVELSPLPREKLLPEGKVPHEVLEEVAKDNKELHEAIQRLRKGRHGRGLPPGVMITQMEPGFVTGPGLAPGAGVPADQVEKLTRTIDDLAAEVRRLQATVERLQKQVESAEKK